MAAVKLVVRIIFIVACWAGELLSRRMNMPLGEQYKFKLLRHYLVGSGKKLELGPLDLKQKEYYHHSPWERTTVVETEQRWLEDGAIWMAPSPCGDWYKAFGGIYVWPDKGIARDLYDWHEFGKNEFSPLTTSWSTKVRWPDFVVKHLDRVKAARIETRLGLCMNVWNAFIKKLGYDDVSWSSITLSPFGAIVHIALPDGMWPKLGGKEFISEFDLSYWTFTVEHSRAWTEDDILF